MSRGSTLKRVIVAAVALILAAIFVQELTNIVMQMAQSNVEQAAIEAQEHENAVLGRRIMADVVYFADKNMIWIRARVPDYGDAADLNDVIVTINGKEYTYEDADGKRWDACSTTNPYSVKDAGDVNYARLGDKKFSVVWLQCDGNNDDTKVRPHQIFMIVLKYPFKAGDPIHIAINVKNGGSYKAMVKVPESVGHGVVASVPV